MRSPTEMQMSLAIPTIVGLRWERYPNYSLGDRETLSHIVEVAAWLIVWKTIFEAVQGRRRHIEHKAAKAEYEDSHRLEDEVDHTLPKWMQEQRREQHRERQRQLLVRYPEAFVAQPASRYYRQAEQEQSDEKTPFKENLKENWWLLAAGMTLGGYMLIQLVN